MFWPPVSPATTSSAYSWVVMTSVAAGTAVVSASRTASIAAGSPGWSSATTISWRTSV